MSLKAFHVVFIIASLVLSLGFGVWAIADYRESGSQANLWMGVASFLVAAAIIPYGVWFLRKLKKVSYL